MQIDQSTAKSNPSEPLPELTALSECCDAVQEEI